MILALVSGQGDEWTVRLYRKRGRGVVLTRRMTGNAEWVPECFEAMRRYGYLPDAPAPRRHRRAARKGRVGELVKLAGARPRLAVIHDVIPIGGSS